VDGGRLGQVVADVHHHLVAAGGAYRGAEVGAVGAPGLGGLASQELAGALLEAQVEDLVAGAVQAWLQQRRDLELVGEAELADVAHVRLGPEPGRQPGQTQDPSQTQGQGANQQPPQQPASTTGRWAAGPGR
jgi:hypothetical protein